ncbi:MAG: MBL fold metallo-hydrolase [Acidobacteria bacterium]|nr:MBL fold metallo-hydrolase [Acidobacteriota bacterium]
MKLKSLYTTVSLAALVASGLCLCAAAQKAGGKDAAGRLKVYFVDVEGGQSTLFVTPEGGSLLIDTGWQDNGGRDADRIVAAAKMAGISKIDAVLLTHYHEDHVGGVPQLVARIPVGMFIDHGPNREFDHGITEKGYAEYQKVLATGKYKRIQAHAGEVLPIPGMSVRVISADGRLIEKPLPGAGEENPYCKVSEVRPADQTENARSLGVELTFGKLKILDLGDLTWDKEMQLMCPVNKLGHVDVLVVSHHGWYQSSSPALVDAIHARVAIMDNGETKGGSTPTLKTFAKAPGLEALWQLHYSDEGGAAYNRPEKYIANMPGTDAGHSIEMEASKDGSFEVVNSRNDFRQRYAAP